MALAKPPVEDNAYAAALALLERAPLIDGHNDLPYVIRLDRQARGDVAAYDLTKVHAEGDTDDHDVMSIVEAGLLRRHAVLLDRANHGPLVRPSIG